MPRRKRGNGEGTVTQRPDGRWMGQFTLRYDHLTGRQERATVYGDTAREVFEKMAARREEVKAGGGPQTDATVGEFLASWLAARTHSVKPASLERYAKDVGYIRPYLGKRPLASLAAVHVTQMFQKMEADGRSRNVRYQAGTRLRHALKDAVRQGLVKTNVAALVPLPRVERQEMRPLHPEEVPAFLKAATGRRLEAFFVVALDTGARMGELLALRWEDWHPASREVSITKTYSGRGKAAGVRDTKTRSSRRRVMLSPAAAEALERHRQRMRDEGHAAAPAFCTRTGGYHWRSHLALQLAAVLAEAGLPHLRLHDLRHSTATLLLAAGVDVKSIAARLGHANPRQVLTTYAHVLPSMHQKMASVMDSILAPPTGTPDVPAPTILKIAE